MQGGADSVTAASWPLSVNGSCCWPRLVCWSLPMG
ncbi:hypothetical protein [Streptomyces sp. NPDC088801]